MDQEVVGIVSVSLSLSLSVLWAATKEKETRAAQRTERERDKETETKGTGHPMSCLAITFTTQQINSKRRIFACVFILFAGQSSFSCGPANRIKERRRPEEGHKEKKEQEGGCQVNGPKVAKFLDR